MTIAVVRMRLSLLMCVCGSALVVAGMTHSICFCKAGVAGNSAMTNELRRILPFFQLYDFGLSLTVWPAWKGNSEVDLMSWYFATEEICSSSFGQVAETIRRLANAGCLD